MENNLKTKEDLDKEKQEDRVSKNLDFMNKSDEDYQKELDEYAQFPQFKYQQEMFAKQYDDQDKELSRAAKTYSVLHNARSGMEALPAVAGSGIVSTVATPIIAGIMSAAGRPLARVYNGPNGKIKTDYVSLNNGKRFSSKEKDKIIDDYVDLIYADRSYGTETRDVPQFTKDRPIITKYGSEYNKSLAQPNQGNYAKNLTDIKGTVEDLNDATPPKAGSVTNVGKEFSMTKPKFANAISNAIKIAKGLGDAATSYGIGAAINKGDDNYNDTLARKYTRDYFYDLPSDSRKKIKEEGLNEEIFNEYVAPFIKFTESNKYAIDEPTLTDMLKNKKFDELKLQYGIDATDWQNADKKTKKKLENYWLTAKNRKRAFEEGR